MSFKRWMDNAFWENPEHTAVNCIYEIEDDAGRVTRQVMLLQKEVDGDENPDFIELVDTLGEELINNNTEERIARKKLEAEVKRQEELEYAKARKLEQLFEYKLQAFEVEEIKNSKNRPLKAKLRRAKNKVEVDLYSIMILLDEQRRQEAEAAQANATLDNLGITDEQLESAE